MIYRTTDLSIQQQSKRDYVLCKDCIWVNDKDIKDVHNWMCKSPTEMKRSYVDGSICYDPVLCFIKNEGGNCKDFKLDKKEVILYQPIPWWKNLYFSIVEKIWSLLF